LKNNKYQLLILLGCYHGGKKARILEERLINIPKRVPKLQEMIKCWKKG